MLQRLFFLAENSQAMSKFGVVNYLDSLFFQTLAATQCCSVHDRELATHASELLCYLKPPLQSTQVYVSYIISLFLGFWLLLFLLQWGYVHTCPPPPLPWETDFTVMINTDVKNTISSYVSVDWFTGFKPQGTIFWSTSLISYWELDLFSDTAQHW